MVTFSDAIKVDSIDDHTYSAHFPEDWCIGSGECQRVTHLF